MTQSFQKGPQGVRGDRYSGSKVTNSRSFQPFYSATEKIHAKYYKLFKNRTLPLVKIEPTHKDYILPISKDDITSLLERIPTHFIEGIKAILVTSGSKKQIKVIKNMLHYGEYWEECVFIHPYPKVLMTQSYDKKPNPQTIQEYQRAGGVVTSAGSGVEISFNKDSLRRFYLRDVLMHEIGHHNEGERIGRSRKKSEGYANWFATEYGSI